MGKKCVAGQLQRICRITVRGRVDQKSATGKAAIPRLCGNRGRNGSSAGCFVNQANGPNPTLFYPAFCWPHFEIRSAQHAT
jgi:hypothetical protein